MISESHAIRRSFIVNASLVSKAMLSSRLPFNNIQRQMFTENLLSVMDLHIISFNTYSNFVRFSEEEAKD